MIYYDNKEFESERLYELYILNKFLAKYYGEKNALKFMKASVNDIDKLAKDLGSRDITFFCYIS
jgi:hypothetical protein